MDPIFDFRNKLLSKICNALQLTDTQFGLAKISYNDIGDWLGGTTVSTAFTREYFPRARWRFRPPSDLAVGWSTISI